MKFRPCIDIHQGQVKQIVGSTLTADNERLQTNFVATMSAADYALMYKNDGLSGGHLIRLDQTPATKQATLAALAAYPNGLQVGGGITHETAGALLASGAQKVIVTSFGFTAGRLDLSKLERLKQAVGREQIVFDLACRKRGNDYVIVTNRWQDFTDTVISTETVDVLAEYVSEFLLHGVDQEGKSNGIDTNLIQLIADISPLPVTYAGGIKDFDDISLIKKIGQDQIDYTIGSALDIFGGEMKYRNLITITEN